MYIHITISAIWFGRRILQTNGTACDTRELLRRSSVLSVAKQTAAVRGGVGICR